MKYKRSAAAVLILAALAAVFALGFLTGRETADNIQVTICAGETTQRAAPPAEPESDPAAISYPIDLNTATRSELDSLPGIGPALAEEILHYRAAYGQFIDKLQIMDVPGIGESKYAALEQLITVKEAEK